MQNKINIRFKWIGHDQWNIASQNAIGRRKRNKYRKGYTDRTASRNSEIEESLNKAVATTNGDWTRENKSSNNQ